MTERRTPDRGRRRKRLLLGLLTAIAVLAAMSGCVSIKSQSSSQLQVIGNVQLNTTICASDKNSDNAGYNPADASCQGNTPAKLGNSNADSANSPMQVSLAYRVPNLAQAPSSFTSTNTSGPPSTPCGGGVTFNQNAGLASAIEALSPAGSGMKWVAYYSTTQNFTTAGCQYISVAPQFGLGQSFGIIPFTGPFNYRTVVGYRSVDDSSPGNTSARAASCGSNLYAIYADGVDGPDGGTDPDENGVCFDSPDSTTIGTNLSQATRDLGMIPQTNASVSAGQTAQVTFNASYKGAALPSGQFNLAANTTISGATATPSITSLTPAANSDTTVTVTVPVPPGTTPGTYNVFLNATLSTNPTQTRGGIVPATITVGENFNFGTAPALPSLGALTLNGQSQTKTAQMGNFSVIDSPGSSDQGWNVTVVGDSSAGSSPVFKQYCPGGGCGSAGYVFGGFTLPANSLTLNSTGASWTGGTGATPAFQCAGGSCAIDTAAPTKIASAANGGGTSQWTTSGFSASSVRLATPSTLRALPAGQQYKVNVVWTLNSGP